MLPPAKDGLERQGRPTVKNDGLETKSSSEPSEPSKSIYLSWCLSRTDILLLTYIWNTPNIVARAMKLSGQHQDSQETVNRKYMCASDFRHNLDFCPLMLLVMMRILLCCIFKRDFRYIIIPLPNEGQYPTQNNFHLRPFLLEDGPLLVSFSG